MVTSNGRPRNPDAEPLVARRLAERGIRFTPARRLVAEALATAPGPRTAAELQLVLQDAVPTSSLYRTLAILEGVGVLAREHGADGAARYELAEWLTGHHHHLVCITCGTVEDMTVPPATENRMGALIQAAAAAAGYQVTRHRLDIEGRCPTCRRR